MSEPLALPALAKARIRQIRRLKELEPVLYDSECFSRLDRDLPVYEIYRDCCDDEAFAKHVVRYDVTVMPPLLLGEEYVKTRGHYHLQNDEFFSHPEIFEVLEGEAQFLMQRRQSEEVADTSLQIAKQGQCVLVPPNCGHVMINASLERLVVGNLISRACIQLHSPYAEKRGAAFYVLAGGRLVRNPRYSEMPEMREIRTLIPETQFTESASSLVEAFLKDPDRFRFLNGPDEFAQKHVTT